MQLLADKFRKLVDQSSTSIQFESEEQVRSHFIKDTTQERYVSQNYLVEILYKKIHEALMADDADRSNRGLLRRLRTELYRQEGFDLPTEPYEGVIDRIWDASRSVECVGLDNEVAWLEAITIARAICAFRDSISSSDNRRFAVNKSIRFLRHQGFDLLLDSRGISFKEGEDGRLFREIDGDIAKLGGTNVIAQILHYLRSTNKFDGDRYTPGRNYTGLFSCREPSLPVGYLLNLAIKHTGRAGMQGESAVDVWVRICERAVALCSILDIEPYNNLEKVDVQPYELPYYLSELSLFDHIFTFKQWTPRHAIRLLSSIFSDVDEEWMASNLGWTIADALSVADKILTPPPEPYYLKFIRRDEIVGKCISEKAWRSMCKHFVHMNPADVNSGYLSPMDGLKANWQDKPLISFGTDKYFALPGSVTAPAIFEAISRALRGAQYPSLDDTILPNALEKLIFREFERRGYGATILGKKYNMYDPADRKNVDGECDVVVEGENYILFIEAKKKPLTKASTTGADLPNLIDISESLLHAQSQMAVHERLLRYHGFIQFSDQTRLEWKDRRIDRIAVTLLDHGSTQDKTVVEKLRRIFARVTIAAEKDPQWDKPLVRLNERCAKMAEEIHELEKLGVPEREQGFSRWFMSIPQLMALLDVIGEPQNFRTYFGKLRHMTFSILDFYREIRLAEQMGLLSAPAKK